MNKAPFKFLDSYTLSDKEIFFGREKETEEIYSRLFYSKLLLIYGPSGSGKTSLLQCGVSSRFGDQNWKPLFIRCKQNIIDSIHAELDKQAITSFKKEKTVTEKLYSLYLDFLTPIYLVFDQFEELFIFGDAVEKKAFAKVLKEILSQEGLNTHVILSIREEYLANLSEFEDEIPWLFDNRIRVEKMKKAQALSVITSPCEVCNVGLEKGLAETAVEKIINESATIELTWLQVLMDRLYKSALARKEESVEIKLSDLEALGNIGDVLGNFLDEQLQLMPDGKSGEAILKTLITSEGTKRQLNIDEIRETLLSNGYKLESEAIRKTVQHFVTVRILSDKDENDRYELKHDSLAAKIFERLTLSERELQEVRQFVENAYKSYLKTEHLLGKRELAYVGKYEDKLYLNEDVALFLKESKQILVKRAKTQRRIRIYSILSFVLLCLILLIWTRKETKDYTNFENAVNWVFYKDDDPKLNLASAIYSYKRYKSPITSKALFESFNILWDQDSIKDSLGRFYSPYDLVINFKPCKSEILFADYSYDGILIYGYLADASIIIWSENGKELFNHKVSDKPVLNLKISPDNKFLTCFNSDSIATLFDISGKIIFRTKICFDLVNSSRVMAFSPNSRLVAYSVPGNQVKIFHIDGTLSQVLHDHSRAITAIAFSKNGQFLATASKDNTIIMYYFNKGKKLFDIYSIIKSHKNIVWSVEFADNGKYMLSASEDSTILITDFTGKDVLKSCLEKYFSGKNLYGTTLETFYQNTKAKYSDAFFSPENNYIAFRKFNTSIPDSCYFICLSWNSLFYGGPFETLFFPSRNIKFLSSGIVYKSKRTGKIWLMGPSMEPYFSLSDSFHNFSVSKTFMFAVKNNVLRFYPLNEGEVLRLTEKCKIFGKLE